VSFIQNLFTSRDNNANGANYVGQQSRIWWNPDTNAFYYSDGNTSGGILITGGSSGNGLPGGSANTVQYNAGGGTFGGDPNFVFDPATSTLTITNIVANTLTGGAGGTNTQVQFNTNGNFTGTTNFTYNQSTNAMLMTGTATLGNVFPASNNVSNIGSLTNRFNDIWLGTGNINLVDNTLNTDQQIYAQSGNLVIDGGNGLVFGQFAMYGNNITIANGASNINIGKVGSTGYVNIERPLAVNSVGGGLPAFRVEQNGTVSINSYGNIVANSAALLINATTNGNDQPRNFEGTLIQATAQDNTPARMSADAFGLDGTGQNAYASWAARVARGNVNAPSQTQAGDTMFRFTSQGWSNAGAYIGSIIRYNQVALENFATGKAGTRHNFSATPVGTATIKSIANIDGAGITFSNVATGGLANVGITFPDGSYQNTAYLSTSVVRSLTAGAGISLSSNVGNITITNTGVLGIVGTVNQISITGNVGNVVTLGTPQDLAPTSNVQFNNLTVNNLSILGNVSNVLPSIIDGPVVYVANTATTYNAINNSGLSTGNISNNYYASILYQTSSNTWNLSIGNSQGITAGNVFGNNATFDQTVHVGNAYNDYDFPDSLLQGDINVDSYGQFTLKNHSQTANASADIVAVANNGDDTGYYIDMGINSNVYANVDYAVTGANDGYLYVNGGNLVIGTQTAAKAINFFTGGTDNTNKIRGTLSDTGLSMVGNVTANNVIGLTAAIGGVVTATGNITGGNLLAPAGIISASGNITGLNVNTGIVSATGNIRGGNINTTGLISTAGNVQAGNLSTSGIMSSTGNIIAANIAAGNITSAIISATGNITGPNIIATVLQVSSLLSVTGNIQGGNFLTDGLLSTTGNITGNYFIGNGSLLTGINLTKISNGTSQVNIPVASSNANITIGATSNVAVFATTGAYITGVTSVTGNVVSNNVIATTIVNAASYTGGLVSVTGNVTANNGMFTNIVNVASHTGSVVSVTGNVTANNGMFTNIVNVASHTGTIVSVTGNVNGGNVIAAANLVTVGVAATGNISTSGNVTGAWLIASNGNTLIDNGVSTTGNVTGAYILGNIANATGGPSAQIISTWIPTLEASGGGTFTYTTQHGNYAKSGRNVTLFFTISISGVTGVSGTMRVGNLPYTGATVTGECGGGALDNYSLSVLPIHVTGVVGSGSTHMDMYWHDRSGSTNNIALMTTGQLGTVATLTGRITYISAS
jgi:hypothetical protein